MNRRILAVAAVDNPGGAELHLLRLLEGLAQRGWTVAMSTPGAGPLRDRVLEREYRWVSLPVGGLSRGAGRRAIGSWPKVRRLSHSVDVVYLNGGVAGRLLPALSSRGPKRVLHIHDIVERAPRFWRRAEVVLADSGAVANSLAPVHADVVFGPVDPDPPAVAAPWSTGNGPIVGFVGRIEPRKGVLDLVHAAGTIRAAAQGSKIVLVGDDPYGVDPGYTRSVVSSEEIEHYGWRADAPSLMRHMDVLVLPSYREPFGTVLAEAMAVGTPVVASAVDGLPEVVRDGVTGRLVPPGSPTRLAEAVLEVLAHRDEMGAAAREHARRFLSEDYVTRVERLIAP